MASLTKAQREALRMLWREWPLRQDKRNWNVNLRTVKALAKLGLVEWREFWDDSDWPPRPTRASDHTWEAWLTDEGEQEALRRGYPFHENNPCPYYRSGGCQVHRPADGIPLPVLREPQ